VFPTLDGNTGILVKRTVFTKHGNIVTQQFVVYKDNVKLRNLSIRQPWEKD
jgi:hypothetical protein